VWRDRYGNEVGDLADEILDKGESSALRVTSGLLLAALVQRVRSWKLSWKALAASGATLAFIGTVVVVIVFSGTGSDHLNGPAVGLTKGTIPAPINGTIDTKKVPDYISVTGRDGRVVGYIPKSELFPTQPAAAKSTDTGSPSAPYVAPTAADQAAQNAELVKTVYGPDLVTVVGHMYPGVGFVPLGGTPGPSTVTPVTGYGPGPPGS